MKNSAIGDIKSDDMNNPLSIPNTSYDELQEFNKSDYHYKWLENEDNKLML